MVNDGAAGRLVILGAGGTSLDFAEAAQASGWEVLGFLDDSSSGDVCGLPILGPLASWTETDEPVSFFCGIGSERSHRHRLEIIDRLAIPESRFAVIVHPDARVSPTAHLSPGCGILAHATVGARAQLESHVEVLQLCLVAHDTRVESGAILAGGANLAGGVRIGRCAFVGAAAAIRGGVTLGDNALLGMHSTLLEDQPANTTWVGSPARPISSPGS